MLLSTFGKEEKLCSQKLIGDIFLSGKSFLCYPLKVVWKRVDDLPCEVPVQIAFSVPKRNFKRAHDRNRIKRLMRESYRLQKSAILLWIENEKTKYALMVVYIGKDMSQYSTINSAIAKCLMRLRKEISL